MVAKRIIGKKPDRTSCEEFYKRVSQKAYELWQKRGGPHGNDWTDWFEAEKLVKAGK